MDGADTYHTRHPHLQLHHTYSHTKHSPPTTYTPLRVLHTRHPTTNVPHTYTTLTLLPLPPHTTPHHRPHHTLHTHTIHLPSPLRFPCTLPHRLPAIRAPALPHAAQRAAPLIACGIPLCRFHLPTPPFYAHYRHLPRLDLRLYAPSAALTSFSFLPCALLRAAHLLPLHGISAICYDFCCLPRLLFLRLCLPVPGDLTLRARACLPQHLFARGARH